MTVQVRCFLNAAIRLAGLFRLDLETFAMHQEFDTLDSMLCLYNVTSKFPNTKGAVMPHREKIAWLLLIAMLMFYFASGGSFAICSSKRVCSASSPSR